MGRYNEFFSLDISHFNESLGFKPIAYGFQIDDTASLNEFNSFLDYHRGEIGTRSTDYGYDDEASTMDLTGENGTINVAYRLDVPPYAYRLNGELYGTEIFVIYGYAIERGLQVNLIEAQSIYEQIELLKNKTCTIAGGLFPIMEEHKNEIAFSQMFRPSYANMILRYENTKVGNTSNPIYNTLDDFDGELLGSLNDNYYLNLTKSRFPNSNITTVFMMYILLFYLKKY